MHIYVLLFLKQKFRLEVGTQAMQLLIKVLQTDRSDTEIVGMSIETLCNIMSTEPQVQGDNTHHHFTLITSLSVDVYLSVCPFDEPVLLPLSVFTINVF